MIDLLRSIFPCRHRKLTRPFTLTGRRGAGVKNTYVVCLDCGTQFSYDWEHMRVVKRMAEPAYRPQPLGTALLNRES